MCYNHICQDVRVYGTEGCSAKCNNHGVRKCSSKKRVFVFSSRNEA